MVDTRTPGRSECHARYATTSIRRRRQPRLMVIATNKGDPTTLTHFVIAVLPSWWMRLRFRPKSSFLVLTPEGDPLPRELNPGQRWTGAAIQDDELNKLIDGGNVYAGVYHALRPRRPVLARVQRTKV
jgi:hypothetical protein